MSLEGKAAIVTGAASGIGRATAERLVAQGCAVLAVDLRPLDEGATGVQYAADLTEAAANEAAVAAALERFGRLGLVVANAGVQHVAPIEEFPVKSLIEPSEVAELVTFLAGPGGRAFTGSAVTMDQGWTAR